MPGYVRSKGVWKPMLDIRRKSSGSWNYVNTVQLKSAGVWKLAHNNVPPPLSNPEISIDLVIGSSGSGNDVVHWRYLNIGAKLTSMADESSCVMIRVLVSTDGYPSSPTGQGYIAVETEGFPNEPWSDFYFHGTTPNGTKVNRATTNQKTKNYPRNAGRGTVLPAGKTQYVSAWALDNRGQWGSRVTTQWLIPTGFGDSDRTFRTGRFTPTDMSSAYFNGNPGTGSNPWVDDPLVIGAPGTVGANTYPSSVYFFYGQAMSSALAGADLVKDAKIYFQRSPDAHGSSGGANWPDPFVHNRTGRGDTTSNDQVFRDTAQTATVLRGQSGWVTLTESACAELLVNARRGVGLVSKDQDTALVDRIKLTPPNTFVRMGELYLEWRETA